MPMTNEDVMQALATVEDPDLKKDLVTLKMAKQVEIRCNDVHTTIELTTPACPMKDRIRADVENAIKAKAKELGQSIGKIEVTFTANVRSPQDEVREKDNPLPNVKHVIAIGAGKGGVGKSTVSTNVAVGLARFGAKVGLLDGDIYGPSGVTMLGLDKQEPAMRSDDMLKPFEAHGIRIMTIGKLVPPDKALIWRGPMAHGAFKQLATQTDWGELDYLIVDLPPGTGDVPLTLCQILPLTGAVVVCTPQRVAQDDARRAVKMFEQLGVGILGVVENMSYFIGDDGKEYDIFGKGGAEKFASELNLPFLGSIPIHMELRVNCDNGTPLENWNCNPKLAQELDHVCQSIAQQISIVTSDGKTSQPTLSIS